MFRSIEFKILSLLFLLLAATMVFVVVFVDTRQRENTMAETDRGIDLSLQTLILSLKNMMIQGEAPIVVRTVKQLADQGLFKEMSVYRVDGSLAFSDFQTLDWVNAKQNTYHFARTERLVDDRDAEDIAGDDAKIQKVLKTSKPLKLEKPDEDEVEYFYPIQALDQCFQCHTNSGPIRGVVDVSLSTKDTVQRTNGTTAFLVVFFSSLGLFLLGLSFLLLRSMVLTPVLKIGRVVAQVGDGNLAVRVDLRKQDEIGTLAEKINTMIQGLEERFRLTKYVSHRTVRQIQDGDDRGSRKSVLTLLFSDIRNFTPFAEAHTAEEVVNILNRVLEVQAQAVERRGGDVEKFVGDEIMAVFEDPLQAVRTSMEMVAAVRKVAEESGRDLRVGIGLNTGEVVVGSVGSQNRKEWAVIGDVVNTASRLCALAPPNQVFLSESTWEAVKTAVKVQELPPQLLKGKKNEVKVYRLLGLSTG